MEIRILDFKSVNKGSLRAFADIQYGEFIFRDLRVIKENGKRAWVAAPQTTWKEDSGNIRYKTVITFPEETKQQIDRVILDRFWELEERVNGSANSR